MRKEANNVMFKVLKQVGRRRQQASFKRKYNKKEEAVQKVRGEIRDSGNTNRRPSKD